MTILQFTVCFIAVMLLLSIVFVGGYLVGTKLTDQWWKDEIEWEKRNRKEGRRE
jgi:membrane protein DedA with SNARE-associated domain